MIDYCPKGSVQGHVISVMGISDSISSTVQDRDMVAMEV